MRTAVLSTLGKALGFNGIPVTISGKTADGVNKDDFHGHAHFLSEPCLETGTISHVCISVPSGISPELLPVLAGVRYFIGNGGRSYLLEPDETDPLETCVLCAESASWLSVTPFVPGRHPRIRRSERASRESFQAALDRELEAQARGDLSIRGFTQPLEVRLSNRIGVVVGGRNLPWRDFRRWRKPGAPQPAVRFGHGLALRFEAPVRGPIALGYASHFGLGTFVPAHLLNNSDDQE